MPIHCQRYLFADSANTTVSRDAVAPPASGSALRCSTHAINRGIGARVRLSTHNGNGDAVLSRLLLPMADRAEQYDRVQLEYQSKDGRELLDKLSLGEEWSILDLGCGTGYLTSVLAETVGQSGRVTGVDPDSARIALA